MKIEIERGMTMMMRERAGVNFINVLWTAFAQVDLHLSSPERRA
jgi:hypothetical protein